MTTWEALLWIVAGTYAATAVARAVRDIARARRAAAARVAAARARVR